MRGKIYFPNLNGLRFIAAFLVIIHHVEQFKSIFDLSNYWHNPFIDSAGRLGVILFFVLSGFLITYLLLAEKSLPSNVDIKKFYIRRILRIWPLYYVIVILGLFILPQFDFFKLPGLTNSVTEGEGLKIILFCIFMPNLAILLFSPVPFASQSWSVGVEEQFYLIWPLLVKFFRKIVIMLIMIVVFYILIKIGLYYNLKTDPNNRALKVFLNFWNNFSIDCMAIGGLAAWAAFYNKTVLLKVLFNTWLQTGIYIITIFCMVIGWQFHFFNYDVYSVLFAIIILNLAVNPKSILKLEYRPLNYLGKISYGLYMYHSIAIVASIKVLLWLDFPNSIAIYILSTLITIGISSISYEFIEKKFIKLKSNYSKIISGQPN